MYPLRGEGNIRYPPRGEGSKKKVNYRIGYQVTSVRMKLKFYLLKGEIKKLTNFFTHHLSLITVFPII